MITPREVGRRRAYPCALPLSLACLRGRPACTGSRGQPRAGHGGAARSRQRTEPARAAGAETETSPPSFLAPARLRRHASPCHSEPTVPALSSCYMSAAGRRRACAWSNCRLQRPKPGGSQGRLGMSHAFLLMQLPVETDG